MDNTQAIYWPSPKLIIRSFRLRKHRQVRDENPQLRLYLLQLQKCFQMSRTPGHTRRQWNEVDTETKSIVPGTKGECARELLEKEVRQQSGVFQIARGTPYLRLVGTNSRNNVYKVRSANELHRFFCANELNWILNFKWILRKFCWTCKGYTPWQFYQWLVVLTYAM